MKGRANHQVCLIAFFLTAAILISAQKAFADPNLVANWEFDEGSGSTVADSSGYGNDGTIAGADWVDDPCRGITLDFNGISDYVSVPDSNSLHISQAITVSAWINLNDNVNTQAVVGKLGNGGAYNLGGFQLMFTSGTGFSDGTYRLVFRKTDGTSGTASGNYGTSKNWDRVVSEKNDWQTGLWYHVIAAWDGTTNPQGLKMYVNALQDANHTASQDNMLTNGYDLQIGRTLYTLPWHQFNGKIDDVRIYDRILSDEEIIQLYQEGLGYIALDPNPPDGAVNVDPNVVLSWSPWKDAASHNVYLGTNYDNIKNADVNSPQYKGSVDTNSFDAGSLNFTTTYYWRIDEVNGPHIWKGYVWSFHTAHPTIGLSTNQFEFYTVYGGANPADQVLGISNSGPGLLSWNIKENCNWLTLAPDRGDSTGEVDDVNLSVDISGLSAGTYSCYLTVYDFLAQNTPKKVRVILYVDSANIKLVPHEYTTIQAAINASTHGDSVVIAPGTYTGSGNKDLRSNDKAITIRSAVPHDPCLVSDTIIDCESSDCAFYLYMEYPAPTIAGLKIINGYAVSGGAIYLDRSNPTIENCIFTENLATASGGAINCDDSNPTITDCTFSKNVAKSTDNGDGGAMSIFYSDSPLIDNCSFIENSARYRAGGIYNAFSSPTITNCTFTKNSVELDDGGGIANFFSTPVINNCTFFRNLAGPTGSSSGGGAILNLYDSNSIITNCTIVRNKAIYGGGILNYDCIPIITGCIIWYNSEDMYNDYGGPIMNYNNLPGGWLTGQGNISAEPLFVDYMKGDLHLLPDSPCINAGDPNLDPNGPDIDGQPRIMLGRVDIGADEFNPFKITYDVIEKTRISRTSFEYDCNVILTNLSTYSVNNVQLEIISAPENTTVIDPNVAFGDTEIGPTESAASLDTCTFQIDRSVTTDSDEITWKFTYQINSSLTEHYISGASILSVIPGDLDGNNKVDFEDLRILAGQWLQPPGEPSADIAPFPTGDNFVDLLDFALLADNWLKEINL